jgi:hypothetical protein
MRAQLSKAQRYQETLARLGAAGAAGDEASKSKKLALEFDHALRRAGGERLRDDPALLNKSLKRKQKAKARSGKEWAQRKAKEEAGSKERSDERNKNLATKRSRALKKADRNKGDAAGKARGGGGGGGGGGADAYGTFAAASADSRGDNDLGASLLGGDDGAR